jgi:hypothetical protein
MQKIRIKKAPQLGEQVDYSFYDSRYRNMGMGGTPDSDVKNTMGPVPREEANIEVELGEVVVGDTNQDGFLELFTFTGKPHTKGGTPVNIPPGSFIFSNTKKLFIKDESLLKELFGLPAKKGGYSPAEIAKKYQINEYVDKLKNKDSDNLTKRTAQTVLDKNLEKLGELALIQESMKGFPDGIPAIALAAAEKMGLTPDTLKEMQGQGQPQQGQQMPQEGMMPPQGPQEEMMEPQQEPMTQEMMEGMMRRGGRVLKRYQGEDGSSVVGEDEKKKSEEQAAIQAGVDQLPSLQEWAKLHQRVGPFNHEVFGMYDTPGSTTDPATGLPTTYRLPKVGTRFFINDTSPLVVTSVQPEKLISNWNLYHPMNRDIITVKDELTGRSYNMSEAEFMMLVGSGSNKFKNEAIKDPDERRKYERSLNTKLGSKFFVTNPEFTTLPNVRTREIQDEWGNKTGLNLSSGDKISYAGKNYDVITPYGERSNPYAGVGWTGDSWKRLKDTFDNTQGIVLVKGEDGNYDFLEGEDIAAAYKSGMPQLWAHVPGAYLAELATPGVYTPIDLENSPEATPMESVMLGTEFASPELIDSLLKQNPDTTVAYDTKKDQTIISTQKPLKVEEKVEKKKKKTEDKNLIPEIKASDFDFKKMGGEHYSLPHYMTTFEMGGNLPFYQDAGFVKEKDLVEKQVSMADGSMVWTWQTPDGRVVASSISQSKARIKKDNFINAQRIAANDAEIAKNAAANNTNNTNTGNTNQATSVGQTINNTTNAVVNNTATVTNSNNVKTTNTGPQQEQIVRKPDGSVAEINGNPVYKQPNGDLYVRERSTGKVIAIKHTNGDVTNISSNTIVRIDKDNNVVNTQNIYDDRIETLDSKGNIIDIQAPDPKQVWNDLDWQGEYMDDVKVFESLINDPKNQNLKDAMYEEFRKIAATAPNSKELLAMKKEDALKYLMEGNRQNAIIQSAYKDQPEFLTADRWDRDAMNRLTAEKDKKGSGRNRLYKSAAEKLKLKAFDEIGIQAYQAMYQAAQRLAKTPEYAGVFKDFDINPIGVNDDQVLGQPVSKVDKIAGNTYIGQMLRLKAGYKPPIIEITKEESDPEKTYYCIKDATGTGTVIGIDISKGESVPENAGAAYKTFAEAERACIATPKDLTNNPDNRRVSTQLWGPDKFAILSAIGQKPPQDYSKYITRRNVVAPDFAYALESPDTFIQAANSQAGKVLDYLGNTTAANVAMSSNFNNLGELAKGIGDVQNRNIATVNDAAYKNAALNYDANKYNQTNLAQNDQLAAAYKRDYDNATRSYQGAINKAIIKGWGNMLDTNLVEQSIGDQFSTNRDTGQLYNVPGTGRDITNPYYGASTNSGYSDFMSSYSDDVATKAQEAYNKTLEATGNQELAKLAAENVYKMAQTSMSTSSRTRGASSRTYLDPYNRPKFS